MDNLPWSATCLHYSKLPLGQGSSLYHNTLDVKMNLQQFCRLMQDVGVAEPHHRHLIFECVCFKV